MNSAQKIKYLFDNGFYAVKRTGHVYSLNHFKKEKYSVPELVLPVQLNNGYLKVVLYCKKTGQVSALLHRVVWQFFNGSIAGGLQVNHKNCIKADCRLSNLELVTAGENHKHAYRNGRKIPTRGELSGRSKLKIHEATDIKKNYKPGKSDYFAKKYGVTKTTVLQIAKGERWAHLPK
jgi:hypothetical protein